MPLTSSRKLILSTLWIFVTLNYLYCDVIGLMDGSLLKQYLSGKVNGIVVSENFLLAGALLMEIPIAMILLSRILPHKANRIANIIAGSIKTIAMIATLFVGPTSYYIFFASIEIATTLFIIWYAVNWTRPNNS